MSNEMTAKEYAKQYNRMHDTCRKSNSCNSCPFDEKIHCACDSALSKNTDLAIELVSKWAAEHPERTYKQDFLSHFPKAKTWKDGLPCLCRSVIYIGEEKCDGDKLCDSCWNEVMPEVQE